MSDQFHAIAIQNIPDITEGDDLAEIFLKAISKSNITLENKDILVIAHKVFSKSD